MAVSQSVWHFHLHQGVSVKRQLKLFISNLHTEPGTNSSLHESPQFTSESPVPTIPQAYGCHYRFVTATVLQIKSTTWLSEVNQGFDRFAFPKKEILPQNPGTGGAQKQKYRGAELCGIVFCKKLFITLKQWYCLNKLTLKGLSTGLLSMKEKVEKKCLLLNSFLMLVRSI